VVDILYSDKRCLLDERWTKRFIFVSSGKVVLNLLLITINRDQEFPDITVYKSYKTIHNTDMYWQWMNGVLLPGIFNDEDYNGNPLSADEIGYLNSFNKIFGSIRLRQNRVRSGAGCNVVNQFARKPYNETGFYPECFASYEEKYKSKESYGPDNRFTYKNCDQMGKGIDYAGRLARTTYDCSGFAEFIPTSSTMEEATAIVDSLQKDLWIDQATRSIFVEFFVYNSNLNYFISCKTVLEVTAGGGLKPTWQFRVFKLETLHYPSNYVHFSFSCILIPYVLFYIYGWTKDLYTTHISSVWYYHFFSIWNIVDIVNFVLFLVSFILRIMFFVHPDRTSFKIDATGYPPLDNLAYIYALDIQIIAVNTVITFFKVFKFFALSNKLNILISTIKRSIWGLFATIIMLFICVSAFAFGGLALFSSNLDQFKDISSSYSSLLRTLLGDFDYDLPKQEYTIAYPVYFSLFVILGFVFILNMFVSVINDSFNNVADAAEEQKLVPFQRDEIEGALMDVKEFMNRRVSSVKGDVNLVDTKYVEPKHFEKYDYDVLDRLRAYSHAKEQYQPQVRLARSDVKKALGPKAQPELIARVMDRFDGNADGIIESDELEEVYQDQEMVAIREELYGQEDERRDPLEKMLNQLRSKIIQVVERVDRVETLIEKKN
jgi:hypothetical protein